MAMVVTIITNGGGSMNGLLVAGTASEVGKSAVTAGICRWLARRGVKVAPFKAQNMSLNSVVTRDGAEIGRAQAMQAAAAGIEPEAALNPILLKPGGNGTSQVMVLGEPFAEADAVSYPALKPRLAQTVLRCLAGLADRFDAVICEGAGSPAEINLRGHDIANMGLARAAGLPVIVVADIDRGGALAALYGTLALLSREDQALVAGFVVNKFRGDAALLRPGLDRLGELTGRPVLGVLPWAAGLWLDAEDSLSLGTGPVTGEGEAGGGPAPDDGPPPAATGSDVLRVAVIRLPRISNFTDTDPLAAEPGVAVRFVTSPAEIAGADLVILPGSRATVADLAWLRERGLADAVAQRAARGGPVLGICGGYQMLAQTIRDDVESGAGLVNGLGLLPAEAEFGTGKVLRLRAAAADWAAADGEQVTGYEIHHGVVAAAGGEPFPGGCAAGAVLGTMWHGIFESDGFRRALLRRVAATAGRSFEPGHVTFAQIRERKLDTLADLVGQHLDTGALLDLIGHGAPAGLPFVPPGAP
jgi:adenosylcobyric acid synthase